MIQLLNFMLKLLNIYLQSINYDARDVYSNDLRREVKDEFDAWLSVPETRQVNATSPIDPPLHGGNCTTRVFQEFLSLQ